MSMYLDEPQIAKTGEEYRGVEDVGRRAIADETIELDVPALAAMLSQRLHAAGLPVSPDRAVTFARALSLVGPVSSGQLYCTASAVFVSSRVQQPTFDGVFDAVFGCAGSAGV